jgi:hypothetical protein
MLNQHLLFVADTTFIDSSIKEQYALLSIFPQEQGDGAYRASLDELLQRSKLQSAYYDELLPKLLPVFDRYMAAAGNEAIHLIRPTLVSVTSLFVDRCIRVIHRVRQQQGKDISVLEVEKVGDFQWLSESIHTWQANQDIIQRIMVALGYQQVTVFEKKNYPEFPTQHTQPNLIFWPQRQGFAGNISKLISRFFGFLEKIPNRRAKLQSLGFSMDRYYLAKYGIIGPLGPFQKRLDINFESSTKNLNLRENLLNEIEEIVRPQFVFLFSQLDQRIQRNNISQLSQAYTRIFIDWFPIGFLEGLSNNLEKVRQNTNMKNILGIIGHSMTSDIGYLASIAARLAGKLVIGAQHGGHYCYCEDNSAHGQSEYALYDKMITWGWTHIEEHFPQCETIPLPSPKLSEQPFKSNYLEEIKSPKANKRDILFLSNQFHRFPNPSTCGQSRVDFIDEICKSQTDLMRSIQDAELTISHKPFSMKLVDLYPDHYRRLEVEGGPGYNLLKSTHKGLTVKLIKTCRIVLYDQIGTGTLECLTSEVPCIVYWKRIYSREAPCAKDLVAALEQYGVIHSNTDTLVQEIKTYLSDPDRWMNNPGRKKSIQDFCRKFALADPSWHHKWKEFLSNPITQ